MITEKPILKSKLSIFYESILKGDEQDDLIWDELFLLKVNYKVLEEHFSKLSSEELIKLKGPINTLFRKCVEGLKEDHHIKSLNILITLSALVRLVWRRDLGEGFRAVDVLIGFDDAEHVMMLLIEHIHRVLTTNTPQELKYYCLLFLKILTSASDNISQNTTVEFLMLHSLWQSICKVVVNPQLRSTLGSHALSLLALLLNYRKNEYSNPYITKMSACDDDLVLNGFGEILLNYITSYNNTVLTLRNSSQQSYSEYISSWIYWTYPEIERECQLDLSLLLCLYETVHLNRSFITILTQTMSSTTTLSSNDPGLPGPQDKRKTEECHSNLLSSFLTFTSLILSNTKDNPQAAHLCFNILLCVSEDNYACAFMHDDNQVFPVFIYRTKLRHRKESSALQKGGAMSLAYTLLDLMSEFLATSLTKHFNVKLYGKCYQVIHRVLCYQKKCGVRLSYPWTSLWNSIIAAVKWSNSLHLDDPETINNYIQVCRIFNMFVMYGDTFLPSPGAYDELYYELLRQHQVFDGLNESALKYSSGGSVYKERCGELTSHLHNVRAIVSHFSPKIEAWSTANHISTPAPEEVMEIVRSNYGTLTLKLQDGLDNYERYSELPREQQFFTNLVRGVCKEKREKLTLNIDSSVYKKCTSIS